jgi:hypothetical protein
VPTKLCRQPGNTIVSVCNEYGLGQAAVRRWVRQAEHAPGRERDTLTNDATGVSAAYELIKRSIFADGHDVLDFHDDVRISAAFVRRFALIPYTCSGLSYTPAMRS